MLTQFAITNAKPKAKPYKLADQGGLYLLVKPTGMRLWRFRYRFAGKENTLSFGSFPAVPLGEARGKRDEARKQVAAGIDPSQQKKLERIGVTTAAQNTFKVIAGELLKKAEDEGAAEATMAKNRWLLEDLAAPLATRPITQIKPVEVLNLLRRIERTGRRETAHRLRGAIGGVFRFAIITSRAETDPTAALRGALLKPQTQHRASITDEQELGALMRSIDEYDGWPTLTAALGLLALTMTRPGDVRHAKRPEFDLKKAVWRIPGERMKMRRPHDVPLSRQAVGLVEGMWDLSDGELLLPSIRSPDRPLSENAMNSALRRMGYTKTEVTAHGFRSSASTILNERGFDPEVIEAALAHQDENEMRRIYNRATYWDKRVKLMQAWADLLDEFRQSSVTIRKVA
ncbi:integrase arm-type DNA-binding domain-containing protein [Reyranella sp.]|uniref:tyrosine-type recombinase/integrase n=1 Tax=Reyranella sp. TaxID=1929291 RepID=UPI00272F93DB|nr:integrase arm-type DNA-binding domain-containing protein [Reyranella sp.]MDP2378245.1 tyrosine-type recombinase/integrase [Reyranella sp.]